MIQGKIGCAGILPSTWDRLFQNLCASCDIDNVPHYLCACWTRTVGDSCDGPDHGIFAWNTGCGDLYGTT